MKDRPAYEEMLDRLPQIADDLMCLAGLAEEGALDENGVLTLMSHLEQAANDGQGPPSALRHVASAIRSLEFAEKGWIGAEYVGKMRKQTPAEEEPPCQEPSSEA
jgi:hypothetical protein